jgi:hypothetical protein
METADRPFYNVSVEHSISSSILVRLTEET